MRAINVPIHHEVVTLPILGRSEGFPVVVTSEGALAPLATYLAQPTLLNKSSTWRRQACRAVGLFFDYTIAVGVPDHLSARKTFLSDFVYALTVGTGQGEDDPSGLHWVATSWTEIGKVVRHLTSFAQYCEANNGSVALNPLVEPSFGERVAGYARLNAKYSNSMFSHLQPSEAAFKEAMARHAVQGPRVPKSVARRVPAFPPEHFARLVQHGFRLPGSRPDDPPWKRWNLRDIMIVILQAKGGVRESEPFHMFAIDVKPNPEDPTLPVVFLCHPQAAQIGYRDPATGRDVTATRTDYLRDCYGLSPRNTITGKRRAGWKDLLLDEGKPRYYAVVKWVSPDWARVFAMAYKLYLRHVLPSGLSHPFLFVNLREGDHYGAPYTLAAYNQNLATALRRIGLESSKEMGTTSHGLRHGYGQVLRHLNVSEKVIALSMHHKSLSSQEVYTRAELAEVDAALTMAAKAIAADAQTVLSSIGSGDPGKSSDAPEALR